MPVRPTIDLGFSSLPTPTVSDQYTANLKSSQQSDGSLHSVTLAQIWNRADLFPIPEDGLFRTPSVTDSTGGARSEKSAKAKGRMVKTADQVAQLAAENGFQVSRAIADSLLPTPVAQEGTKAPSQQNLETKSKTGQIWLSNAAQDMKLGWGKFEPAIRRWEQVLGRPAPAPTKPDGKDGNHRLSSEFTEWMMGLPAGWVTGCGLSRNDELKACGNGVVPQQAEMALRQIMEGME